MDRTRGQKSSVLERQKAVKLINTAIKSGACQALSCKAYGVSVQSFRRWNSGQLFDQRKVVKNIPPNKLSKVEEQSILKLCNTAEFCEKSPHQIVPILLDKGIYLASESTFYRVLRKNKQVAHRGKSKEKRKVSKPKSHQATKANMVWTWDITYLKSDIKGQYYFLYLMMDIYSRKIVGWEIYKKQTSENAAELLRKTALKEGINQDSVLVLHSDNGTPMKGSTMLATMQHLGIVPSFSRPSVSNDNPYSESLFKTIKYTPLYPSKPFSSLKNSREWMLKFSKWYNFEHRHSGIKFVTPHERHIGTDFKLLAARTQLYLAAQSKHPERWSGNIRNWIPKRVETLNPEKEVKNEDLESLNKAA